MNGSTTEGVQGLCPAGWHLPTSGEFSTLKTYVGENSGTKLKSTDYWAGSGNGTNNYGFNLLPFGNRFSFDTLVSIGEFGPLWSSTTSSEVVFYFGSATSVDFSLGLRVNSYGYGARCIKN